MIANLVDHPTIRGRRSMVGFIYNEAYPSFIA